MDIVPFNVRASLKDTYLPRGAGLNGLDVRKCFPEAEQLVADILFFSLSVFSRAPLSYTRPCLCKGEKIYLDLMSISLIPKGGESGKQKHCCLSPENFSQS